MAKLALAASALALGCIAASAHAGGKSNRVWVSGHGADQAGCGAPTEPCRSLQYAHDNAVAAGGEIDILDPAGYGSIFITKSVSIVNDGVGTAGVQATGGSAVLIDAGPSDAIYLRGLNVDGVRFAADDGIVFNSGAHLTVTDCVVRHFNIDGIAITGAATVIISNTTSSDNNNNGLLFVQGGSVSTSNASLDHFTADNNGTGGILVEGGEPGAGSANLTFSNTIATGNGSYGVSIQYLGSPLTVNIDNSSMNLNQSDGLAVSNAATVYLSRSMFSENGASGVNNQSAPPGGVFSNGDNRMEGNLTMQINGNPLGAEPLR